MQSRQVIENSNNHIAILDLQSKLLQSNIMFITGVINEETVSTYQAELFYLSSKITGDKSKTPIKIYINSPGGEVYSCFGLLDVMQQLIDKGYIIETKTIGLAASAAAMILMCGSKGYRSCTKHSRVMVHQPSSGTFGTVTDMKNDVDECLAIKEDLNNIVSEKASADLVPMMERDKWLNAEQALQYGIIDKISK